jgi:hypothetical protein
MILFLNFCRDLSQYQQRSWIEPPLTYHLLLPSSSPSPFTSLQHFGHTHASIDIMRAARLGAYGLLIDGPVGSKWYDLLEACVFPKDPISTKAVLAKTALDQVVYATIMTGGQRSCVCVVSAVLAVAWHTRWWCCISSGGSSGLLNLIY